jgi:hypothetical protein
LKFSEESGKICFERMDGSEKSVSLDYYPEQDPIRELIEKKDIAFVLKSLNESFDSMKVVGRNQKFLIERNEINREILEKS